MTFLINEPYDWSDYLRKKADRLMEDNINKSETNYQRIKSNQ